MTPRPCIIPACTWTPSPRTPRTDTLEARATAHILTDLDRIAHQLTHDRDEYANAVLRAAPAPVVDTDQASNPLLFVCPLGGCAWNHQVDTADRGWWRSLLTGDTLAHVERGHRRYRAHVSGHLRSELAGYLRAHATR
ncbi:hypothetical protein [Nocardiopsis sp. FR26]|uniref:hypothetical protein n=1 Tax=Nocardiopsis sp. FR26 TaxID=2605987 RepID=UPI001357D768|nr:hypothetical protein [Nocardiopsis sp. FR26]